MSDTIPDYIESDEVPRPLYSENMADGQEFNDEQLLLEGGESGEEDYYEERIEGDPQNDDEANHQEEDENCDDTEEVPQQTIEEESHKNESSRPSSYNGPHRGSYHRGWRGGFRGGYRGRGGFRPRGGFRGSWNAPYGYRGRGGRPPMRRPYRSSALPHMGRPSAVREELAFIALEKERLSILREKLKIEARQLEMRKREENGVSERHHHHHQRRGYYQSEERPRALPHFPSRDYESPRGHSSREEYHHHHDSHRKIAPPARVVHYSPRHQDEGEHHYIPRKQHRFNPYHQNPRGEHGGGNMYRPPHY